jgi:hypothetical protein
MSLLMKATHQRRHLLLMLFLENLHHRLQQQQGTESYTQRFG